MVVRDQMKRLATKLFISPEHDIEIFNILLDMGTQVWKSAIDLKNQKGSISFTFTPSGHTKTFDAAEQPPTGLFLVWFPEVTVERPQHSHNRSFNKERSPIKDRHQGWSVPRPKIWQSGSEGQLKEVCF